MLCALEVRNAKPGNYLKLVLLYNDSKLVTDEFPHNEYALFDLEKMSEAECKAEFMFVKTTSKLLSKPYRF